MSRFYKAMHAYTIVHVYYFIFHLIHISCCLEPLTTYCHACGWEDGGVWVNAYECTVATVKLTKQNKSKQYNYGSYVYMHVLNVNMHAL